jgi:hypothetical protein
MSENGALGGVTLWECKAGDEDNFICLACLWSIMSRGALIVNKQLENVLIRRPWRLDRALLKEHRQLPSGFIPFSAPSSKIYGNILFDESLSFPVQVRTYFAFPSFRYCKCHPIWITRHFIDISYIFSINPRH